MALQPHGRDSYESFAAALAFLDEALNDSSASTQGQPATPSAAVTSSLPALTEDEWDPSLLLENIGDFGEDAMETVTPLSPSAATTLATLSRQLQLGTDHFDGEGAGNVSISRNSKKRKTTKTNVKKQLGYDPNKARNGRRFEIIHLRKEAAEMELKLQQLLSMQERENCRTGRELSLVRGRTRKTPMVWEEICNRQLERRLKAERDNALLKKKCEKGKQVAKSIEKMVRKRLAQQGMELSDCDRPTRRVKIPPGFQSQVTNRIFEELLAGVDASYREIETVLGKDCPSFPTRGLGDDASDMQVNLSYSKIMPFDITAVGDSWWGRWHNYKGQNASDNEGNNTITEKFGLEMRDARTNATATFYDQQILRRNDL
ncbi:M96 mating-specific protein [Phytophthora cinnamomi]|uniref:M96 mating-specific protein n=1 Tax=Phytophthora cinnamomi TaxID=4785 RepID=UPI003559CD4E|nr:M96 mating-specific protein [Phytophthora cinnamomi]